MANQLHTLHDPIDLNQLAAISEERHKEAASIRRLSRISWGTLGVTIFLTSFILPIIAIAPSGSLISLLAIIFIILFGFGSILTMIGTSGTVQHRKLRYGLELRTETNSLIRRLMPDLPKGHQPLLTQRSRGWYWLYFAGFVIIQFGMLFVFPFIYPLNKIADKIFPSFPFISFVVFITLPSLTVWTIWFDLWMGQSILSIWRWVRYGMEPKRGIYCLLHGLSLIILTILPLSLLYLVTNRLANPSQYGLIIVVLTWLYTSRLVNKFVIGFPVNWITKPVTKGRIEQATRRLNFLKTLRPYNPNLNQAGAIVLSYGGHYAEAEQAYRSVLAENPPIENQIMALANIVDSLMEQRKYQQAIAVLDVVMYIAPEMNLNYLNLAEIYLLTKGNPARVLEVIELGLEQRDGLLSNKKQKRHFTGAFLIAKAWALAELGQHQAAYDALQQAWLPVNLKHVSRSTQANMHYMTGRIYHLESQPDQAIQSFQKAQKLHPAGAVARRAETALNYLQAQHNQLNIGIA